MAKNRTIYQNTSPGPTTQSNDSDQDKTVQPKNPLNQNDPQDQQQEVKKMEDRSDQEKLDILVDRSKQELLHIKTVFPFDLFPKEIVIDQNKVDIAYHDLFSSGQILSILIKSIKIITVTTTIFLASLNFILDSYDKNPVLINNLHRDDAIKAKRIIMGLMASLDMKVDFSKLSTMEIATKLEEIGKAREVSL